MSLRSTPLTRSVTAIVLAVDIRCAPVPAAVDTSVITILRNSASNPFTGALVPYAPPSRRGRDAHDRFPEIAAFEHPNKSGRRVLNSVGDVLAITHAAIGDRGRYGPQEVGIVFRGELVVD